MFTARTVSRAAAATGALACALLAAPSSPAAAEPYAKHCADYPNRDAAQEDFLAHGGSPTNNWHGMDNDHDGQACEHHRYPGQPTPPPNPGPSGCAVCSPTPEPSASPETPPPPTEGPATPPPPEAQPTVPPSFAPVLPITGPTAPSPAVAGAGASALLLGAVLLALGRRRRT